LPFDSGQRRALGFGLDDADDLAIDVEHVVRSARTGLHDHLAHPRVRVVDQIELVQVADVPASGG
jgi:hypothetical protein